MPADRDAALVSSGGRTSSQGPIKDDDPRWLGAFGAGRSRPDLDGLRAKIAGLHFAKESLSQGERQILWLAEAVLAELDRRDADGYAR